MGEEEKEKYEFRLPIFWWIGINRYNISLLTEWREKVYNYKDELIIGHIMWCDGTAVQPRDMGFGRITTQQFKIYVLKSNTDMPIKNPDYSELIALLAKLRIV